MSGKILTIITLALCMALPLSASTVTLEEALASANANNTDLEAARVTLEGQLRNNSVSSSLIPDISLSGGVSWNGISMTEPSAGSLDANLYLSAGWNISSSLITDIPLKELNKDAAALSYTLSAETVEEAVTSAYWNIALYRSQVESAKSALESAEKDAEIIQSRYEAGLVDELELASVQNSVLTYRYQVLVYENQLSLAYSAFSTLTGIAEKDFETEELPEIPSLSLPSADELIEEASGSSTTMQNLRKQLEIAKQSTKSTRAANQLPSITLSASYTFGQTNSISAFSDLVNDNGSVSVGVSVPISSWIPGSTGDNAVKSAQDNEKLAAINIESGLSSLYQSIEQSLATLSQSQESLEIAKASLSLAERTLEITRERYEAGYISYDELADAREDVLTAQQSVNQSTVNRVSALHSLSFDTGLEVGEIIERYSAEE